MADIKINEKLVVSQTGTAEPVLASNVDLSSATGIPAAGITGTLGSGVTFPAGHIIQVVNFSAEVDHSGAGNDFTDQVLDGFTTSITPASATNKLYLICTLNYIGANGNYIFVTFERAIAGGATTTDIAYPSSTVNEGLVRHGGGGEESKDPVTITYLDSPNTTSVVTYQVRFRNSNDSTTVYCGGGGPSTMTIMEVVA